MGANKFNVGGKPAMDEHPIQGGVQNWDKFQPDWPLGSYAYLTYLTNRSVGMHNLS